MPPSNAAFHMALAAVVPASPARAKAASRVRFWAAPKPMPNKRGADEHPADPPAWSPAAQDASPSAARTSDGGSQPAGLSSRSASSPARHRDTAPVTPKRSSATVARAPSGRSIGRNVTRPPPARVTTNRTTDGSSAARAAARPGRPPVDGRLPARPSARSSRNQADPQHRRRREPGHPADVPVEHERHSGGDGDQVRHGDRQPVEADRLAASLGRCHAGGERRAQDGEDGEARAPHHSDRRQPGNAVVQDVERRRQAHGEQAGDQHGPVAEPAGHAGMAAWTVMVTARKTAVTTPAVLSAAPPRTA